MLYNISRRALGRSENPCVCALSALLVEVARIGYRFNQRIFKGLSGLKDLLKNLWGWACVLPDSRLQQSFRDLVTEAQSHVLLSFDWCHLHMGFIIQFQICNKKRTPPRYFLYQLI